MSLGHHEEVNEGVIQRTKEGLIGPSFFAKVSNSERLFMVH